MSNDRLKPVAGKPRKKWDKYRNGRQVAEHKEKAAVAEAQIKSLFAVAKSSSGKVKSAMNAKIKAELRAEVDTKQADLTQGGMKLKFFEAGAGGLLARRAELEAESKEEHAMVEAVEKGATAAFAKQPAAAHMLDAQKEAELRSKVFAGDIAEAESDADLKFGHRQRFVVIEY